MWIEWDETLSVGHETMDGEHQAMVAVIRRLYDENGKQPGSPAVQRALDDLLAETRAHFASEEGLMRAVGYTDAQEHRDEHAALLAELQVVIERARKSPETITIDTLSFITAWFTDHVQVADLALAQFIEDSGPITHTRGFSEPSGASA